MLQIRTGVYETNSSSMHSVVVLKENGKHDPEDFRRILKNGIYKIDNPGDVEFYREPFRILATFQDKLRYAMAALPKNEEIDRIVKKFCPEYAGVELPTYTIEVFKNDEGQSLRTYGKNATCWRRDGTEDWYFIDKDGNEKPVIIEKIIRDVEPSSEGEVLSDFLSTEGISLEDFLTFTQYVVVVDGDEICEWEYGKRIGVVDTSEIDHEFPVYDYFDGLESYNDTKHIWGGDE